MRSVILAALLVPLASCEVRMSASQCELARNRLQDFATCLENPKCVFTAEDVRTVRLYRDDMELCDQQHTEVTLR